MPRPGFMWRHVTISTHSSWLPGDRRGWRSRKHKRHSSGDYKQPPPAGEHAGLHRYAAAISDEKVVIPPHRRSTVGEALLRKMDKLRLRCLCIAVHATHGHLLIELPIDPADAKTLVGQLKQYASHQVRREMPGQIWSDGCDLELVQTMDHLRAAYRYILTKQGPGAWTWSSKRGVVRGVVRTPA